MVILGLFLTLLGPTPYRSPLDMRATGSDSCASASGASLPADAARLEPGRYRLTLVATRGSRQSHRSTGELWLWPTSAIDRSPTWPNERPGIGDTVDVPLYGAADLDWRNVAAPIALFVPASSARSSDAPRPDSRDPLHPGVLVRFGKRGPLERVTTLFIGTRFDNRRVVENPCHRAPGDASGSPCIMYSQDDAGGMFMSVHRVTNNGFGGTWGPWGLGIDGAGYYCAVRQAGD
jgi:hypothetical protein